MKAFKFIIPIAALAILGIVGTTVALVKFHTPIKVETPQVKTTATAHYIMPSIFPQVLR